MAKKKKCFTTNKLVGCYEGTDVILLGHLPSPDFDKFIQHYMVNTNYASFLLLCIVIASMRTYRVYAYGLIHMNNMYAYNNYVRV